MALCRFFIQYENGRERTLTGNSFEQILNEYVLKNDRVLFILNQTNGVVLSGVLNGRI